MQMELGIGLVLVVVVASVAFYLAVRRKTSTNGGSAAPQLDTSNGGPATPNLSSEIAEEFNLQVLPISSSNIPQMPDVADVRTVQFVIEYCCDNLQYYDLKKIYFFGSRATGVLKQGKIKFGDHDFMVVVGDTAAEKIRTGTILHSKFYDKYRLAAAAEGIGSVDLLITGASQFSTAVPGTHSFDARSTGIQVYSLSEPV